MAYQILNTFPNVADKEELRLAKIDWGYTVGVWDFDGEEYQPYMRVIPFTKVNALEEATKLFNDNVATMKRVLA